MRLLIAGAVAAVTVLGYSAPALSKAHAMPSDRAQVLGQANADTTQPTGARNGDAKAILDDQKGVVGQTYSDLRQVVKGTESGQKSGDMVSPK